MMELVKSAFSSKLFLVTSLFLLVYIYLKKVVFSYWKRHNVPHDDPVLIFGTIDKELLLQKLTLGDFVRKSYVKFKNHPFHGVYTFLQPNLMINDLDLIKNILIRDFSHFTDRGIFSNENVDPMSANIIFLKGEKWKHLREKCNTFFTPSCLRKKLPLLNELIEDVVTVADELIMKCDIVDMKEFVDRYFVESLFNVFFEARTGSMRNSDNEIKYYGRLALRMRPFSSLAGFSSPKILEIFRIPFFNAAAGTFFFNLFKNMINKRKLENVKKNDFLELLINIMENDEFVERDTDNPLNGLGRNNISRKLNLQEASAQAFIFFVTGFETSSALASLLLQELSVNPDVQDKLYEEIDKFQKSSEELNFENLMNLPYLDMVFSETYRKHSIVPFLSRICVKDYKIPNSNYIVPKGMRIMISVAGIHNNPDYYPEPEKFDPTRFSKENVANRHPCTYLPFGIGPRYCIGKRFASLHAKLLIFVLISNYKVSVSEKTNIPCQYSINAFIKTPKDMYLHLIKRKSSN